MTKTEARAAARRIWQAQTEEELRRMGQRMCTRLFVRAEWQQAGTILCFVPLPTEPDISPALDLSLIHI